MARKSKSVEEKLVETICSMSLDELYQFKDMISNLIQQKDNSNTQTKTIEPESSGQIKRVERRKVNGVSREGTSNKNKQARTESVRVTGENKFIGQINTVVREIPLEEKKAILAQQKVKTSQGHRQTRETPLIAIDCDKCGKEFVMNSAYYIEEAQMLCNGCSSQKG